ncbi:MAG: ABC transporter ATP-binding protein [Myxococcales bacterium]
MAKLELKNVSKGFGVDGSRREVLSGIDLTIEDGEFVAIVGFSGVGKTTLISLLAGLLMPDSGSLTQDGAPIRGPGRERGVVFQSYALLPWLSAFENVLLAVDSAFGDLPQEKRIARAEECLALVNLAAARNKRIRELSGGMRQRVSIARALALGPEVLLLDEPLGALDALTRSTLQRELETLLMREKKTMVMITNDVEEAVLLADRVIPLSMGPKAKLGPAFRVDLPRPRDKKLLQSDPTAKRVRIEVTDYLVSEMRTKGKIKRAPSSTELGT